MKLQLKLAEFGKVYKTATIARASGLSASRLRAIVKSERPNPKLETVNAIALAVGVDPLWLIDDRADWPPIYSGRPAIDDLLNEKREGQSASANKSSAGAAVAAR